MALSSVATKNFLATQFGTRATHAALTTTVPGTAAGTEIAGVARQPLSWSVAANGAITASVTFTGIPAGTVVAGAQTMDALTGGNYVEGGAVPTATYPAGGAAGKYDLTVTFTQS